MNNNIDQNLLKAILDSIIELNSQTNPIDSTNPTDQTNSTKPTKPTNRCLQCKKKVGYLGFECKCDGYFCSTHRYPEEHKCSYDHKTEKINKLRQDNPQIMAEKVRKI